MVTVSSWWLLIISQNGLKHTEFYARVTKAVIGKFVRNNLVCCFGLLESVISDNAKNLNNDMMTELCQQFQVTYKHSAHYHPKMNGAVGQ